ncbi:MAG: hypothetical protein F2817_11695, partial [Actinobacteria bacterium]|nr:hypothetical protein [Actinomycetota bacterium]
WLALQDARDQVHLAVAEELAAAAHAAKVEQQRRQAELDVRWDRLKANDPQAVLGTLEEAFADNDAPAAPIDVDEGVATVTMLFGHPDLVPERTPGVTPGGKPTLRKRTKSDRNHLYLAALASNVIVTVKEAFAVAPSLASVRVLVVRRDAAPTGGEHLTAVYAGAFDRRKFEEVSWPQIDTTSVLLQASGAVVNLKGQAKAVAPLGLATEPDLQRVLEHLAAALKMPALTPPVRRSGAPVSPSPERHLALDNDSAIGKQDPTRASPSSSEGGSGGDPGMGVEARRNAVERMRNQRHLGNTDALISATRDPNRFVRREAAGALADLMEPRCRERLAELASDADADVRYEAVSGLAAISDPSLEPVFLRAVEDEDRFVRRVGVTALAEFRGELARKAVRAIATNDADPDVRFDAVSGLAQDPVDEDGPVLLVAVRDADRHTRATSAQALGTLGSEQFVSALADLLADPEPDVRYEAASALGEVGGSAAVEALSRCAPDPDPEVRAAVRDGLAAARRM